VKIGDGIEVLEMDVSFERVSLVDCCEVVGETEEIRALHLGQWWEDVGNAPVPIFDIGLPQFGQIFMLRHPK